MLGGSCCCASNSRASLRELQKSKPTKKKERHVVRPSIHPGFPLSFLKFRPHLIALHKHSSLPEHLELRGVGDDQALPEVVGHLLPTARRSSAAGTAAEEGEKKAGHNSQQKKKD